MVLHEYFGVMGVERDSYEICVTLTDIIDEAFRRIMSSTSSVTRYYGHQLVPMPLRRFGDACDKKSAEIKEALSFTTEQALAKCSGEQGSETCRLAAVEQVPKVSKVALGLKFCEITAVVKP